MDFVTGLPIFTDWKGTSYDSNLVIADRLTTDPVPRFKAADKLTDGLERSDDYEQR